jgi:hypothetical protein
VLEIERLHCYFPKTKPAHQKWGRRRTDRTLLVQAPREEKLYYAIFQTALLLVKAAYAIQRQWYMRYSTRPCPTWAPVIESKEPIQ